MGQSDPGVARRPAGAWCEAHDENLVAGQQLAAGPGSSAPLRPRCPVSLAKGVACELEGPTRPSRPTATGGGSPSSCWLQRRPGKGHCSSQRAPVLPRPRQATRHVAGSFVALAAQGT
jgi:hypothetical protein